MEELGMPVVLGSGRCRVLGGRVDALELRGSDVRYAEEKLVCRWVGVGYPEAYRCRVRSAVGIGYSEYVIGCKVTG